MKITAAALARWCPLGIVMCLACVPTVGLSQRGDLGSWNILNLKYDHSHRLSMLVEGQVRSVGFYNTFHYHEYKAAVSYKVLPALRVGIGGGRYDTYAETGDFAQPQQNSELRIWPHATLDGSLGRVKVEHRYRTELRWTSKGYLNRFRYRLGFSYAFGQDRDGQRPCQVSASNEIFFSDRVPYFERNRSAITLNYRLGTALVAQIGYLHQFDYRLTDETGRDFLMLGLFIELPNGRNTEAEGIPVQRED